MFGKKPRLNPLESRKQLLIAESELNRAQMAGDMAALTAGVRTFTDRAKSFGSIASSAAVLVAGLAAFRRNKPAGADAKPSWATNHSQRRRTDFHLLAGVPLTGSGSGWSLIRKTQVGLHPIAAWKRGGTILIL